MVLKSFAAAGPSTATELRRAAGRHLEVMLKFQIVAAQIEEAKDREIREAKTRLDRWRSSWY